MNRNLSKKPLKVIILLRRIIHIILSRIFFLKFTYGKNQNLKLLRHKAKMFITLFKNITGRKVRA